MLFWIIIINRDITSNKQQAVGIVEQISQIFIGGIVWDGNNSSACTLKEFYNVLIEIRIEIYWGYSEYIEGDAKTPMYIWKGATLRCCGSVGR